MLVDVVCMRHQGARLTDDAIAATRRVRGELTITNHRARNQYGSRTSFLVAKLDSDRGGLEIPQLLDAVVTNMRGDDFTVAGTEVRSPKPYGSTSSAGQTWLCRLVRDAAPSA